MNSIIANILKKYSGLHVCTTKHYDQRENERGLFSNFSMMLKNFLECYELENGYLNFLEFNNKTLKLVDEQTGFCLILSSNRDTINYLCLITLYHGANHDNDKNHIVLKTNTKKLNILRENKLLNAYKKTGIVKINKRQLALNEVKILNGYRDSL